MGAIVVVVGHVAEVTVGHGGGVGTIIGQLDVSTIKL